MNQRQIPENSVAIVGIACRFPGARTLDEYWKNLCDGRESITFFTPEELDKTLDPKVTGSPNYVRAKGKLDDADKFDAKFFGISPAEAKLMDPQQRILLELAWASLEDSGIVPGEGDNLIGVWVGTNWNRYYAKHVRGSAEEHRFGEFNSQLANEYDFPASRIAYKLNLTGPAVTLATACSTSLVALGQAMQSLLSFECNAALAGGISISVPINAGYQHQEGEMLSSDGHCRPFDSRASGTTFNDGAAVVTIKRLEDAVEDGDEIYAVVRGVGINNDGSDKVSYTAPSVNGQIAALESALAMADVGPSTVGMIEAHGTATRLGDPIEVSALQSVYGEDKNAPPCALGSVKSNIGHVIHAAGIAGVVKAAMSVKEGIIPPTLHFEEPNPELNLDESRFYINTDQIEWQGEEPRRAGVSSFGVGGTNAHAIVEQAPAPGNQERTKSSQTPPLCLLSAKDAETTQRQVSDIAKYAAGTTASLSDIGYTLAHNRARFNSRTAIFARHPTQLAPTAPDSVTVVRGSAKSISKLVWAFPGQGAQRPGMGAGLVTESAAYRKALDTAISIANEYLDIDLGELLSTSNQDDQLIAETRYAQPALFAVGYALAKHYEELGLKPHTLVGHSIGEFVAAHIAGVFNLKDAIKLVCERGRLMHEQSRGSMLSVSAQPAELEKYLDDDVCIAAQNTAEVCVLSGPTSKIEAIAAELRDTDIRVSMLRTSHAFHSSMMDGALGEFRKVVESVNRNAPTIRIVSTCTGQTLTGDEASSADYWVNQLRKPVQFHPAVETILAQGGSGGTAMLELGPGRTLTTLFAQIAGRGHTAATALGILEEDAYASSWLALGTLWCAGLDLPESRWWPEAHCQRTKLPSYPFRRDVHWLEPVTREITVIAEREDAPAEAMSLEDQVVALFGEVTGLELVASDRPKPFPELGLDSLLLTQMAVALQESFDVVITIRDLVSESNSIDAVCRLVEARAPRREPDAAEQAVKKKTSSAPGAISIQQTLPKRTPKRGKRGVHRRDTRPQTIFDWNDLGDHRAAALREFIACHAERTKGSKSHTAEFRLSHADPRTAAGFHRVWKEIAYPLVCARSSGAEIWDVDGNRYIDMLSGFGPNMLGHALPIIRDAILAQLESGMEIGPQSALAGETAAMVCKLTGMDRASFMCTGSEAVQAAIRCARTYTRRTKIVIFEGAYHGNFDEVLVRSANQKGLLKTIPGSPGIPRTSVAEVIVLPWNSPASLSVIDEIGDQLAAVMVEPVQSRTPDIQPAAFLRELREITARHETMLIFDEVVTGFRCHPGGAQAHFGIDADLATYGKVAGGNMPIGIVAGREAVMNTFDGGSWTYGDDSMPNASVTFFAGTFVRHPLSIAACHAMLEHLIESGPELQVSLAERTSQFTRSMNDLFRAFEAPFELSNFTSVMYLRNNDVSELGSLFWYALRERGVFALEGFPSYMTLAHTDEVLDEVTDAVRDSLEWMVDSELLVKPRKLIVDSGTTFTIPLDPPSKESRLGEDEAGNPAWYREQNGQNCNVETGAAATHDPFTSDLESVAPTSESQREVWSATQLGDDASCAFNESVSITLKGKIDLVALRRAIRDVAARHKSMRGSISPDGSLVKVRREPNFGIDVLENSEPGTVIANDVVNAFDLVNGPLFRFSVVSVSTAEHILIMTAHHIVCDGWSSYLILKELGNRYRANIGLDVPDLPAPDDLAKYNLEAADLAETESEDYWLDEYSTIPPIIDFPTDITRPTLRTFDSERIDVSISGDRLARYKSFAANSNASLFNVLLAGWYAYVTRITGISDLVVGVPSAGQVSSGMMNLVGHCVNLLPLRLTVDIHHPFGDLVSDVQERLSEALTYQDYTFGRLLQRLPLARDPSRIPIVPMQFNLDPPADPEAFNYGDDVSTTVATNPRSFENFELFLNIAELEDGLDVQLQFNSTLFSAETMARRIGEYFTLLDAACTSESQAVSHLNLLTTDDEAALAGIATNLPNLDHDTHFLTLFERNAAERPDKIAVQSEGISLTYRELDDQSTRLAAYLLDSSSDLESGLIGVALQRRADMMVSLLAVWKTGAAYVPLDPDFPPDRLSYMVEDAGLSFVLTNGENKVPGIPGEVKIIDVDSLDLSKVTSQGRAPFSTDRPAYVIYTSGSTGQPKGVEIGHRAVSNFLQSMTEVPGIAADDVLVAVTTLSFDIAVLELYGPLTVGATTVIATHDETQDGAALSSALQNSAATLMQATPVTWRMLLEAGWQAAREFRVLCGGEAFPADLATQLAARHDNIFNLYGPTEATVWSTLHPIHGPTWHANPESRVPIGRPIHGTTVHVLDEQLQPLPPGVPGELYIGGVGLANRYLNRDELTQQRFVEHPTYSRLYRTGDLVTLDESGVLRFHARVDSQVKVRGFRVELGEIETALSAHPAISEIVANVYEPGAGDARLVAYYVSDRDSIDDSELRELAQANLPRYMVPQHFVPIAAIPLTPNRKADRKALPPPLVSRDVIVAPRNETEEILVNLWKDVLRSDDVSVDDDFFSLGGHSILATRMISHLEDQIGVRMPLKSLFAGAILADFANQVAAARLTTSVDRGSEQREVLEF